MGDDVFEAAAADLEKSIKADETLDSQDIAAVLIKGIKTAATELAKGKGGPTTDLQADKDKRGSLIESGKDPAESPKKSGQGYDVPGNARYEARKAGKHSSSGEHSSSGAMSSSGKHSSSGVPSFFKKKKKKMHKGDEVYSSAGNHEDDVLDATEFVEELGDAVDHINKSVHKLEEGLACFGELLADLADPRRDKLMLSMSKAISYVVAEQKELKKSLAQQANLMKAVSQLPGAPRMAGLSLVGDDSGSVDGNADNKMSLTKAQRDYLFPFRVKKMVTDAEIAKAVSEDKVDDLIGRLRGAK